MDVTSRFVIDVRMRDILLFSFEDGCGREDVVGGGFKSEDL